MCISGFEAIDVNPMFCFHRCLVYDLFLQLHLSSSTFVLLVFLLFALMIVSILFMQLYETFIVFFVAYFVEWVAWGEVFFY